MGLKAKVELLELRLKEMDAMRGQIDSLRHYLETLAWVPEDAVLLYTLSGMRVQHEIGRSAKLMLAQLQ